MARKSAGKADNGEGMRTSRKARGRKNSEATDNLDTAMDETPQTFTSPATVPLNRLLVGGPLLGRRPGALKNDFVSWDIFEPLITPEIVTKDHKKPERFILLPHSRYISVLAYRTGVKIATLVPYLDNDDDDPETSEDDKDVLIECVTLAKYLRKLSQRTVQDVLEKMDEEESEENQYVDNTEIIEDIVVMVGCSDGSIREFSLKDLLNRGDTRRVDCGSYQVSGPCFRPRRIIQVLDGKSPIVHITVPHFRTHTRENGTLVYIACRRPYQDTQDTESEIEKRQSEKKKKKHTVEVLCIDVPHYDGTKNDTLSSLEGQHKRIRSIDVFQCRTSNKRSTVAKHTFPFKMVSAAKQLSSGSNNVTQQKQEWSIFVVIARTNSIKVYYEQLDSQEAFKPMSFKMPSNNPLTAMDISLNKCDITCGHYRGNIRVMNNLLIDIEQYNIALSKAKQLSRGQPVKNVGMPDPRSKLLISRVHWHSLPVSSLVYDAMSYPMDPLLYSGGDESVLVTWQIAQGRDRPVDVLPRLALGGILHLSSSDRCDNNPADGILVFCEDNTLQLLTSHNKGQMWKIQGLAEGFDDGGSISKGVLSLEVDPRSDGQRKAQLVITGLAQAPGYIHWYNPSRERLESTLEVAPFNRISRTEPDELPLPAPKVTCHSFSNGGHDLVTVDEYPTENVSIGAFDERRKGDNYGIVTTIRFWAGNDSFSTNSKDHSNPYIQVVSMNYPHGPKNRVSALALSKDGTLACTVSNDEKAYRIWQKLRRLNTTTESGTDRQAPAWTCRYKVPVPAGFSNHATNTRGVSFSEDGSILAIAFGQFVTLWDSEEARLLTSFAHMYGHSDIELVEFVNPGLYKDLLLVQSRGGVCLRSPYGENGSSACFDAWSMPATVSNDGSVISAVGLIDSHVCVALSIFSPFKNKSCVVLIDVATGNVGVHGNASTLGVVTAIDGCIIALCSPTRKHVQSIWDAGGNKASKKQMLAFNALTSNGELYYLSERSSAPQSSSTAALEWNNVYTSTGPRLDITSVEDESRKRQRVQYMDLFLQAEEPRINATKKMALDVFGFAAGENATVGPTTAELPSLNNNFVTSFVGRNLSRNAIAEKY